MRKTNNKNFSHYRLRTFFLLLFVTCICVAIFSLSFLIVPARAFASEGASGISAILPNPMEFVPMLIAFIIVAIILYKFGWPLFENMLQARSDKIGNALKEAEDKRLEANKYLEQCKQKLDKAESQGDEIIQDAKKIALDLSSDIEEDAKKKAQATKEKADTAIEQKKKKAEHELKTDTVDVAMDAVAKFVSEDLTDEQHRKLIEKYVVEMRSLRDEGVEVSA